MSEFRLAPEAEAELDAMQFTKATEWSEELLANGIGPIPGGP